MFIINRALSEEILSNEVSPIEDLPREISSREVLSEYVKPGHVMINFKSFECKVSMCNEDNSICSKFGDFETQKNYSNIEAVKTMVCRYELHKIPHGRNFTREQYEKYIPFRHRLVVPLYDFMVIGVEMIYLFVHHTKITFRESNEYQIRKFWCG